MLGSERRRYETHLARLEGNDSWIYGRTLDLREAADSLNTITAAKPRSTPTNTTS